MRTWSSHEDQVRGLDWLFSQADTRSMPGYHSGRVVRRIQLSLANARGMVPPRTMNPA
ncbi:hypothetical protein [Halochromatium glycolicum]|uniref:hypothetical protein n=1 Tax=Halochromatium glycolicum TaxID=85075 RepID=UPI00190DFC24|nr:hypothetical protein [Halochromatium glycolicum]